MADLQKKINEAAEYILKNTKYAPKIGVILGSGLGGYGDILENAEYFNYADIPNFPISTVVGHKGRFVITDNVICMQGRFHFYEGYTMQQVTFPIRVMKKLGVNILLVTNASGGVNESFNCGDLMVITDHINFMGTNPLIGTNLDEFGPRFPDMSECYNKNYIDMVMSIGNKMGIKLQKGVYTAFTGPSFETPAEVRMARTMGGDAVGMSTVPEVITAVHCGINVIGISCITNHAAGVTNQPLSHVEVIETTEAVKPIFTKLLQNIINELQGDK